MPKPTLSMRKSTREMRVPRLTGEVRMPRLGKSAGGEGLVGLEIEADSVAAAEVQGSELAATAVAPLPPGTFRDGEVVDPEALARVLKSVFAEHKLSKRVRLGIANQRVVVRTMRLPAIDDPAQLDSAIRFQAEEQIPMPVDQSVLDHRVIGGSPAGQNGGATIDVVVSAARQEMIAAFLKPLRDAGLDPVGIDLSAFGMIRALGEPLHPASDPEPTRAPEPIVLYCNVGDVTNLAIARGRACLFTRASTNGLEDVVDGLCASTGLTPENARLWLVHVGFGTPLESIEGDAKLVTASRSELEAGASSLVGEMRLSADFFAAQEGAIPVERVVLGGPGAAIPGIAEQLSPALGLPIEVGHPEALSDLDPISAARLSLPYGLALEE